MKSGPKRPPNVDWVVIARSDDPRLARVTARAQKRLPEFMELLRKRPRGVRFFIKAAFRRIDGKGHKHMWVLVSELDGEAFVGVLKSDPEGKVADSAGESVCVPARDVEDWYHDRGGRKRVGEFSAPVLDQIERERRKRR
jgi:uncharacterized protein YegJ (DUF2314 family)